MGKKLILQWLAKFSLLSLLWLIFSPSAQAALELRVAIKKGANSLQIGSSTPAVVKDSAGRVVGQVAGMNSFVSQVQGGNVNLNQWKSNRLWLEPSGDGVVWIGDRWYRGRVLLVPQGKGITAINYVDLEDYLYSVVGAEAIPSWPKDALKAQAVAARTYALYKRNSGRNQLFDLDTTTATQVYKGLSSEYTTTHQAVRETMGEVMTYNNQIILAVFHSSSGGHTENVEDIWVSPLPYLRGVVDYDQNSPVFSWNKSVSPSTMSRIVGGVGNIQALIPQKTTPQGRIVTMRVVGDRTTKNVAGSDLRKALDLRSTLFRVSLGGNSLQVSGRGFGHGLGLSQWGAQYLAQNGVNYRQILAHYYRNAKLSTLKTQ
ncbi:MAG: SpoIID/LytB domain-containing protein [Cyanobacteria bacterium J149]|nr:MAG: SpoIID/LytB domain-containing protein [Cyanobacteria bacterium J149]